MNFYHCCARVLSQWTKMEFGLGLKKNQSSALMVGAVDCQNTTVIFLHPLTSHHLMGIGKIV